MRQYSIIVPVLGDHGGFEQTLASVLRYLPPAAQVLVPCGEGYSDPFGISREVELVPTRCDEARPLLDFWRAALPQARHELVGLFLPGIELANNWHLGVSDAFASASTAAVAPRLERAAGKPARGRIESGICGLRVDSGFSPVIVSIRGRRTAGIDGPTRFAGVFRNEALGWLDSAGLGLSDSTLDLELALALRSVGYRAVGLSDWVVPCESRVIDSLCCNPAGGTVRERIVRRHASSGSAGLLSRCARDLFAGRLNDCWSRPAAGHYRVEDEKFLRGLQKAAADRARLQIPASIGKAAAANRSEDPVPGRRAA